MSEPRSTCIHTCREWMHACSEFLLGNMIAAILNTMPVTAVGKAEIEESSNFDFLQIGVRSGDHGMTL